MSALAGGTWLEGDIRRDSRSLTVVGALIASRTVPASQPVRQPSDERTRLSSRLIRLLIIVFIMGIPEAMLAPVYLIYLQDKFAASMNRSRGRSFLRRRSRQCFRRGWVRSATATVAFR